MSHEGFRAADMTPSRRLPPLEAWKKPDKWIDLSTGLARRDAPRLVFSTDDRGFVRPDEIVDNVNDMLFWNDYDWPYVPGDSESEPDDHHFYFYANEYSPELHNGSYIPKRFRELPTQIGRMPRQFHNTIHDFTARPEMPDFQDMEDYVRSYYIAYNAFKRLFETAKKTATATQNFTMRRRTVAGGHVSLETENDEVGEAFLRTFFDKHFSSYSDAIEIFKSIPNKDIIYTNHESLEKARIQRTVKKLGKVVTREYINFTPVLRAA